MEKFQESKTKRNNSLKKEGENFIDKSLKVVTITIVLVITLIILGWLWNAYTIDTLTLSDLKVQNCNQLPNLSELDTLFTTNRSRISKLLDNLSLCANNAFACSQYSKCKKENYPQRIISSGNTIIEWKKIPECGNKNKGGILVSYSSGCEIQELKNFQSIYVDFYSLPIDWYNY